MLLAVAAWRRSGTAASRPLIVALGLSALAMAFLSGTRTVLVIWTVYLLLAAYVAPRERMRLLLLAVGAGVALLLHGLLFTDALTQRLLGASGDYTSGRWDSITVWLARWADQPFGVGLGGIRAMLAAGRPALDGERVLEWPHDEFVRFLVEGGPIGLLFALGLVVCVVRLAIRGAVAMREPLGQTLLLALAADVVAEMTLQNFLNGVYQATAFVLLIGLMAARPVSLPLTEPIANRLDRPPRTGRR